MSRDDFTPFSSAASSSGISPSLFLCNHLTETLKSLGKVGDLAYGVPPASKSGRLLDRDEALAGAESQPQIGVLGIHPSFDESTNGLERIRSNCHSAHPNPPRLFGTGEVVWIRRGANRLQTLSRCFRSRKPDGGTAEKRRAAALVDCPRVRIQSPRKPQVVAVEEAEVLSLGLYCSRVAGRAWTTVGLLDDGCSYRVAL